MNKKVLVKLTLLIIFSIGNIMAINYKAPPKDIPNKVNIPISYENVKESLDKIDNLIIEKEEFKEDIIKVSTTLTGEKKELEELIKEINSNKFINGVENISIEKYQENWKWNGVIVFNSYVEYRNLHKNE